jgi:FtsZ-binding cell division protein ZapB
LYDEETDTYGIDAIGLAALAIKGLKELNKKLECEVIDLQLELKFLKRNFLNAKTSDN